MYMNIYIYMYTSIYIYMDGGHVIVVADKGVYIYI
jgi:hypothetical protein